ncbi:MAG: hypothetical protein H7066_02755 [Cytophagaceae bacterium]|nr:hypothetical protein [Gemmatimonadaceae bacterium]
MRGLRWESQCGFQVVTHGTCYYIRESPGSLIAGIVFGVVLAIPSGGYGVWLLLTDGTIGGRVFAAMLLLVSAVFTFLLWSSARRGRWMLVYDRGQPGVPGEIRHSGKRLPVERVRSLSTRSTGGSPPRSTVVAELHDGTYESLGPIGLLTWPAYWGQQAATWMGLPFRHSTQ